MTVTEYVRPEGGLMLSRVVVPIDWSRQSERALPVAAALAAATGAEMRIAAIAVTEREGAELAERSAHLGLRWGVEPSLRVHWDIAAALAEIGAEEPGTMLCLAAHGRGAAARAILGSVSSDLVSLSDRPLLLVGPATAPGRFPGPGPVVAALDGSDAAREILPLAAGWARSMGVGLQLATVAEPIAEALDGHPLHRLFGPPDPAAYLDEVAAGWRTGDLKVTCAPLFDPIGPSEGLRRHLHDTPASLLIVSTRPRTAFRSLLGSVTTHLLRTSPVPVLAVPRRTPPAGRAR